MKVGWNLRLNPFWILSIFIMLSDRYTKIVMRLCLFSITNRSQTCMLSWKRTGMYSLSISNLDGSILIRIRLLKSLEFQREVWCHIIKQLDNLSIISRTHRTRSTELEMMRSLRSKIILISNRVRRRWMTLIRKLLILILMLLEIQMMDPLMQIA